MTTGTIPIVDCDVHPMYERFEDLVPYMSAGWRRHFEDRGARTYARARDRYNHPNKTYRVDALPDRGGAAGSDRDFTLATHIQPFGIASALLLPQQPYGVTAWGDSAAAYAFLAANNDYFRDAWVNYDDRFTLAVTISPHDPAAAAAEVRRHAGQPGIVGIQLLLMDTMMGDASFDPIYEASCETGLPVAVHQSGSEGCYYTSQAVAGGVPRSYGERHVVLTQVGGANLVDMIVNGTFERFPGLQVVMVEWGFSWVGPLLSRMDLLWERDPAAAPLVRKPPSQYAHEHVTFTTQPLDEVQSRRERAALFAPGGLSDMLLFSSDYPHYDTDDPGFVLGSRIPAEIKEAVCYRNAVRVFGARMLRGAGAAPAPVQEGAPA
ncbi:MAG TPA: amidohydrolase family protein [Streptosporangiaceae bacterium]|jgi:predicted TIM-barrel fold metal-dependent hydrolase|nr:amidohydrolase family protein [Streptosporangiaceae bacterium]